MEGPALPCVQSGCSRRVALAALDPRQPTERRTVSKEADVLHGYLPYEIGLAISALGLAARMFFKKLPEIIAALKTPGEKQPELMRAMHGLPIQAPDGSHRDVVGALDPVAPPAKKLNVVDRVGPSA